MRQRQSMVPAAVAILASRAPAAARSLPTRRARGDAAGWGVDRVLFGRAWPGMLIGRHRSVEQAAPSRRAGPDVGAPLLDAIDDLGGANGCYRGPC